MPASQESHWATPQTIPGYHPETWPPILVADQNRTVHAFSSQWIGEESGESLRAIVYNRWTLEQGWTTPTDIILSPIKQARITDAKLDRNGVFHIVFFGGDNTGADIYYSRAPSSIANDALAWSVPVIIGEQAAEPEGAVLIEDNQGILYVVYCGRQLGKGLYMVKSTDGGENWSDSTSIFFSSNDEPNIAQLHITLGTSGSLHAIWGVYNIAGEGRGIYYSKSGDGNQWNEPALLADAREGLGTQQPTIFEYNDRLFGVYISQVQQANKIIMRRSRDDGETWDDYSVIFPRHVGVNGELSFVVDSNNDLHLFFGQRISGNPDIHGMWHSTYSNNRWTEPDAVIKGTLVRDLINYKGFDPYQARAAISQGNTILLTWRTDPIAGANGVWYTYQKIDSPELPIVKFPPLAIPNINPSAVTEFPLEGTPIITPSSPSILENNQPIQVPTDKLISQNNPSFAILIGTISAVVLVLMIAIVYGLNRGK